MRKWFVLVGAALVLSPATGRTQAPKTFDIYSIDVEGGQATLFVSPSGESLLVDTGNPGDRDADRIAATAKQAGVTRIDYLIVSHYDGDHVGGVKDLSDRLPIRTFVDHGARVPPPGAPPLAPDAQAGVDRLDKSYLEARTKGKHLEVKAGDKVPIQGLDVQVVSSKGAVITKSLSGGATANPLCREFKPHPQDMSENIFSVGMVIGACVRFRMLDFENLTWNNRAREPFAITLSITPCGNGAGICQANLVSPFACWNGADSTIFWARK